MPFGSQSCEDFQIGATRRNMLLSPMPFGSQSCEDFNLTAVRIQQLASPMPFGSQSCEDKLCFSIDLFRQSVTNAFRQSVL